MPSEVTGFMLVSKAVNHLWVYLNLNYYTLTIYFDFNKTRNLMDSLQGTQLLIFLRQKMKLVSLLAKVAVAILKI